VRLGQVPFERLPRLAREAGALVMPYADLPVTRAMQPLKLKEYLATGKPVVVRRLPATRDWADCLDLVDTPEAFSEAVRRRLARGLPEEQARARARLAGETWGAKARAFEGWALAPGQPSGAA
jgi:glycosyltransferase involved in cell wall biosynthesis